jgi:elongation factor Ts
LLEQAYVRDPSGKTRVKDLVAEIGAKTGEKIAVRRFVRYQVGE